MAVVGVGVGGDCTIVVEVVEVLLWRPAVVAAAVSVVVEAVALGQAAKDRKITGLIYQFHKAITISLLLHYTHVIKVGTLVGRLVTQSD